MYVTFLPLVPILKRYCFLVAGFSKGPQSCISQCSVLAEMVCVLALLIHRYNILFPASFEGKTTEKKQNHMLAWIPGLATIPKKTQVRLKERSK